MKRWSKQKKEKWKRLIALVSAVMLIMILLLTGAVSAYQTITQHNRKTKADTRQNAFVTIDKPNIEVALLTPNVNSRPQLALEQVKGVVIHYTANPGTDAMANRNYFESRKDMPEESKYKVSSHFIIGLDGTIVQCIPLNEIAYASNNRNQDTISIECCHPDKKGKFTDATYQSLVHLTAYLCGRFGLTYEEVIRHYDVTGKLCPLYYVKNRKSWKILKTDIFNEVDQYRKKQ